MLFFQDYSIMKIGKQLTISCGFARSIIKEAFVANQCGSDLKLKRYEYYVKAFGNHFERHSDLNIKTFSLLGKNLIKIINSWRNSAQANADDYLNNFGSSKWTALSENEKTAHTLR